MDDDALVARCLAGEVEAFAELVARYEAPLYNLALRVLNDREDARDATQTAFLRAWQRLETFDRRHRFFSWIYRILLNEALNRSSRSRRGECLTDELVAAGRTPDEDAERSDLERIVSAALMKLSLEDRQVLILRHWLELSYDEIAEILGLPEKTVRSRLFSARRRLGARLREHGVHTS